MSRQKALLLLSISLFGFLVPNGMFFYYVIARFTSLADVAQNLLALGFIIDAFMVTGILSVWFARHPIGIYTWKTFLVLSLLGGLGFSLPFFYYLNTKNHRS